MFSSHAQDLHMTHRSYGGTHDGHDRYLLNGNTSGVYIKCLQTDCQPTTNRQPTDYQPTKLPIMVFLTTGTMGSTTMCGSGIERNATTSNCYSMQDGSAEGLWIKDHLVTAELRGLVRCIRRALGVLLGLCHVVRHMLDSQPPAGWCF